MALIISSTDGSSAAALNLSGAVRANQSSLQRLSSGSRLTETSADPAGMAVSMKLTAALKRLSVVHDNLMNADAFLRVQDDALKTIGDLVTRMSELKTFSLDSTKNAADLQNYSVEYWQLAAQVRQVSLRTFNGIPLFSDTDQEKTLKCQSHESGGQTIDLVLPPIKLPELTEVLCEHIYKVVTGVMGWDEAESDAESLGGHLATINSSGEWDEVVRQLGLDSVTKDPLWIGLHQAPMSPEPAGGWGWVTGERLDYQKWMATQPDNGGVGPQPAADGLAWNQKSPCVVQGHMGDEVQGNADNTVSGYVIQYTSASGAINYLAVRGQPMSWQDARKAAYNASVKTSISDTVGLLPPGSTNAHLATLKTAAEVDNAKQQLTVEQGIPKNEVLWLGGYQSLPSGTVETTSTVRSFWHWIADSNADPDNIPDNPNDPSLSLNWGTLYPHGGQPNNLSSSAKSEDVGYISGPFGEWSDSTEDPNQYGVKGYLFEKDNTLSDVTLTGIEKTI